MSGSLVLILAMLGPAAADSAPLRLVVERSIPGVAVGRLTIDAEGRADYRDQSADPSRVTRLNGTELLALRQLLETKGLCRIRSEPPGRLANYLTIESRWPGIRCRVRRTEVGWRTLTGGRVIFDAVRSLLARACGAESCPLGTERRP